jgi:uncharacterized protein (DUF1778 family)
MFCVDNIRTIRYAPAAMAKTKQKLKTASQSRIDIRIEGAKKDLIVRAAEMKGQNLTQYIMSVVWPAAENEVNHHTRIKLSSSDWQKFCERLDAPARDLPELRRLLNRRSRFKA